MLPQLSLKGASSEFDLTGAFDGRAAMTMTLGRFRQEMHHAAPWDSGRQLSPLTVRSRIEYGSEGESRT